MKTEHISFVSKQDELELAGLIIAPEYPKAVLQLAHGMCEHKDIINESKFESAVQFLRDRGYKNVTSKLYEDMRHEVLNEKNKAIVYKDVAEFCEGIIGQ